LDSLFHYSYYTLDVIKKDSPKYCSNYTIVQGYNYVIKKNKDLYYICYIVNVIEKHKHRLLSLLYFEILKYLISIFFKLKSKFYKKTSFIITRFSPTKRA